MNRAFEMFKMDDFHHFSDISQMNSKSTGSAIVVGVIKKHFAELKKLEYRLGNIKGRNDAFIESVSLSDSSHSSTFVTIGC